ncbi:MAG: gephyrin-like molybdotransferase Glp [Pseudomonadota bacterium]
MSGRQPLLSVADALTRILADISPLPAETVPLAYAHGRVLAAPLKALRTQPPFAASAMDGYAVRHADLRGVGTMLNQAGEAAAGHAYPGSVGAGDCVRIFTGAPLPEGTDTILIQEDAETDGRSAITVTEVPSKGRYVRPAGLDFTEGDTLLETNRMLSAADVSLAAAMDHAELQVRRKPVVALISTGDELVPPGTPRRADQIVTSNNFGVAALVEAAGGVALDCGIAADTHTALGHAFDRAAHADVVITLGGASVGDHDLVQDALTARSVAMGFWKLAMRPGKPVMFGTGASTATEAATANQPTRYLGLPGNPVSSLVCTHIFVLPLLRALLGQPAETILRDAVLTVDVPQNDQREEYMRASLELRDGALHVTPFARQDSSILSGMAKADCLMVRPAHSPPMRAGDPCKIVPLRG